MRAAACGLLQAAMDLSEEQQEALATHAEVMVARLTALTRRHHALLDDSAGPQLRPPVSRPNGFDTPVCRMVTSMSVTQVLTVAPLPDTPHACVCIGIALLTRSSRRLRTASALRCHHLVVRSHSRSAADQNAIHLVPTHAQSDDA